MRIYFDTEFSSLWDPQLLSIGFVSDDAKRQLYIELAHDPARNSPFTNKVVMPLMVKEAYMTEAAAAAEIAGWLESIPREEGEKHELVCDFIGDFWLLRSLMFSEGLDERLMAVVEPRCARHYTAPEPAAWAKLGLHQHNSLDDARMMRVMRPTLQIEG